MIVAVITLKILDMVLSVFAFSTTTSHKTSTSFSVTCQGGRKHVTFSYSYPYDLENVCFDLPVCNGDKDHGRNGTFCLGSGSQLSAQFFVFVGVLVFLYCLSSLAFYIVFDNSYRRNTRLVIADFIISTVITLLWITSSSVWAAGVVHIKRLTNPAHAGVLGPHSRVAGCQETDSCVTASLGNFVSLNVSLVFGFLNFLVWLANLWFLYKETSWFKVQVKPLQKEGTLSEIDPQKV